MKQFSEYLNERQLMTDILLIENAHGDIIVEGFWGKLSKLFSFNVGKLQGTMNKWEKNLKIAFIAGQIAGAKGGGSYKEFLKKQDEAAEKGSKELLEETKNTVELLMKKWDSIKEVDFSFAQCKQLAALSKQENDDEGMTLAKKFKKLIDDKFPDGSKTYEKTVEKIDKAGVDKPKAEGEGEEETKEVSKEDVEKSIGANKDVLEPLVKSLAGKIDGKKLTELIEGLMSKDPMYKGKSKAARTANTIGMASVICGAAMITSPKCLERVAEWVIDNIDKLKGVIKSDEIKLNKPEK